MLKRVGLQLGFRTDPKLDYFTNALSTILHKKGINIDCDANVHKNIGYQSQLDIKKVKEK